MSTHTILLVEDDALIMLDEETALIEAGFEVVTATSAEQALAEFGSGPVRFKGLITDIRLGKGQTGWDIARQVRQAVPSMPIIYMSGDSAAAWHAQGVPGSVMIQKPFVMDQILTALTTLLNQLPPNQTDVGSIPA